MAIKTINLTKVFDARPNIRFQGTPRFKGIKRKVVAIDHLSIDVNEGELFGLLGPNGAGKTTLVKMLCTLMPPDEGTALVNGFDITREKMKVKQSIGTLFSIGDRGFFWRLSGYRNLEFFAAVYNVPRNKRGERIKEVMKIVGIKDVDAFQSFQKYSGGTRRKLALARALLADAPVLLLDEPTVELDVPSSRAIRDFIKNDLCKKRKKTILYTTHYIDEADQICDRVAIIKNRLIVCGPSSDIKAMVKKNEIVELKVQKITQEQIEALRRLGCVKQLAPSMEDNVLGACRLRFHLDNIDSLPLVIDYISKEKIRLMDLKREMPTLEDALMQLTTDAEVEVS